MPLNRVFPRRSRYCHRPLSRFIVSMPEWWRFIHRAHSQSGGCGTSPDVSAIPTSQRAEQSQRARVVAIYPSCPQPEWWLRHIARCLSDPNNSARGREVSMPEWWPYPSGCCQRGGLIQWLPAARVVATALDPKQRNEKQNQRLSFTPLEVLLGDFKVLRFTSSSTTTIWRAPCA